MNESQEDDGGEWVEVWSKWGILETSKGSLLICMVIKKSTQLWEQRDNIGKEIPVYGYLSQDLNVFICLSVYLSVFLSVYYLFICLSI